MDFAEESRVRFVRTHDGRSQIEGGDPDDVCVAGSESRSHPGKQSRPDEPGQNDGRRFQYRQDQGGRQHRTARIAESYDVKKLPTYRFEQMSGSTITTSSQRP